MDKKEKKCHFKFCFELNIPTNLWVCETFMRDVWSLMLFTCMPMPPTHIGVGPAGALGTSRRQPGTEQRRFSQLATGFSSQTLCCLFSMQQAAEVAGGDSALWEGEMKEQRGGEGRGREASHRFLSLSPKNAARVTKVDAR